jgi:hypothetical protein
VYNFIDAMGSLERVEQNIQVKDPQAESYYFSPPVSRNVVMANTMRRVTGGAV